VEKEAYVYICMQQVELIARFEGEPSG